ncbi:MAG: hypothetical protein IME98_02475, partial [Proteobacteria bacterium]|nr:hypothetical protein [Pseudomonadota bacterium]
MKKSSIKFIVLLLFIAAAAFSFHFLELSKYLDEASLKESVASYGALAPIVYIFIYAVAPVLMLPGLIITVAGGI